MSEVGKYGLHGMQKSTRSRAPSPSVRDSSKNDGLCAIWLNMSGSDPCRTAITSLSFGAGVALGSTGTCHAQFTVRGAPRCGVIPPQASEPDRDDRRQAPRAKSVQYDPLVRNDGFGQVVEGEPAQIVDLVRFPADRLPGPVAHGEEEVHPFVDR